MTCRPKDVPLTLWVCTICYVPGDGVCSTAYTRGVTAFDYWELFRHAFMQKGQPLPFFTPCLKCLQWPFNNISLLRQVVNSAGSSAQKEVLRSDPLSPSVTDLRKLKEVLTCAPKKATVLQRQCSKIISATCRLPDFWLRMRGGEGKGIKLNLLWVLLGRWTVSLNHFFRVLISRCIFIWLLMLDLIIFCLAYIPFSIFSLADWCDLV